MVSALSEPVAAKSAPNGEGSRLTHYERLGLKPYRVMPAEVRAAAERSRRFARRRTVSAIPLASGPTIWSCSERPS
jgi:hypothetical protein